MYFEIKHVSTWKSKWWAASYKTLGLQSLPLEIDWYGFSEADTDISKIFKSCFLLHYQKNGEFHALGHTFFQKLQKSGFMS